jgi:hypothetical protein
MTATKQAHVKEFVLIGGAGAPNYGDELIVHGWIKYLEQKKINSKVYFFENIASNMKKLHGAGTAPVELIFKDDLVKIAKNVQKKLTFWEQVIRGYRFIEKQGFKIYDEYDLSVFERAESVHLHGGGYLNNYDPEKGFYIGLAAAVNKQFGTKILATGIGFGPVEAIPARYKSLLSEIFARFSRFELRDVDNYRALSRGLDSNCFAYGLDDCYLLQINDIVKPSTDGKRRLFLSFINYNVGKVTEAFWNSLREYSSQFDEVLFFESYPWEDANVFKQVAPNVPNLRLVPVKDSIPNGIVAGVNDVVITSRFHVHFVFSRFGCKGFYSKDSKYYDIKHQSILDRGSNFHYIGFNEVFNGVLDDASTSYIALNDSLYCEQKRQLADKFYS